LPLFKKKPDAMSLTMALVEAHASDNPDIIEQARQGLTLAAITGSTCRRLEVRFNWS
jgi:hypothetical protein